MQAWARKRLSEEEEAYAKRNFLTFAEAREDIAQEGLALRGPSDEHVHTFKGQKRRPDNTFRNPGGFSIQVKKILAASNFAFQFNYRNPRGQPLHVCAYSVVCNVWRVRPRVQLCAYSVVCVCVFSCVQKGGGGNRDSFMFTMSVFSYAYLHDLLMPGWFAKYMDIKGTKKVADWQHLEHYELCAFRQQLVDEAWAWIAKFKGVDRAAYDAECAPMPLHVHAVFANVC